MTNCLELKGEVIEGWQFDDAHHWLDDQLGVAFTPQVAQSTLRYVAKSQRFHPVQEYLDNVGNDDSLPTVEAADVAAALGITDQLQVRYLECWLAGAVSKVLDPMGSPFTEVLTLLSPNQGIGKSEFFRSLASPLWFSDSFAENKGKDQVLALHSSWISEIAELDQYARRSRDLSSLKSFITQLSDDIRPPYGMAIEKRWRQFVFAATTNSDELFSNSDEQRRFWVVEPEPVTECGRLDIPFIRDNRDAIWATAYRRVKQLGVKAFTLDEVERAQTKERNTLFTISNPVVDAIHKALKSMQIGQITTSEVADSILHVGVPNRMQEMQIAGALTSLGFSKQRKKRKLGIMCSTLWVHHTWKKPFDKSTGYSF